MDHVKTGNILTHFARRMSVKQHFVLQIPDCFGIGSGHDRFGFTNDNNMINEAIIPVTKQIVSFIHFKTAIIIILCQLEITMQTVIFLAIMTIIEYNNFNHDKKIIPDYEYGPYIWLS